MTRKALLIGAQTFGLTGVDNDVTAMWKTLDARGFGDIRSLTGTAATRDGILVAYEHLIDVSRRDDDVVVFYSGHGGRLRPPPATGNGTARMDLQYIVPADFDPSLRDGFRGITAVELSVLLARLTEVTPNVTVILDCCHSGLMSRGPGLRIKAIDRLSDDDERAAYIAVAEHLRTQVDRGLDLTRPHVVSNPQAVRIVACSPEQSAYEWANADNVPMGLLTDALTRVLAEVGDAPLSWSVIIQRVRERVHTHTRFQRPEAEGPSRRVPFTGVETESAATLPVMDLGDGYVELLGAPLLGVRPGDEFAIETPVPGLVPGPETDVATVGDATVDRLTAMHATGQMRFADGWSAVPPQARARRTKAVAPALPVRVPDPERCPPGLLAAIRDSTLIRPAGVDGAADIEVCRDDDGRLAVHDRSGRLHEPVDADAAGIRRIVDNLHLTARAAALRALEDDPFDHEVSLEWGRVGHDGSALPVDGPVHVGDHLWFRVRNSGPETVHVSLLDVGLSGRVSLLTGHHPSGLTLPPGMERTIGFDERTGRLVGIELSWPAALPTVAERPESVLVIASEAPVDVSVLQQDGTRGEVDAARRWSAGSPLARLLAQIATGATRDLTVSAAQTTRYVVQTVDFPVRPDRRP